MQHVFPAPDDSDAEDVAWGLTTGAALWRQGERYDAIVWLKRAVEAANEAGASVRADELNRAATDLIAGLAAPAAPASAPNTAVAPPAPPAPTRAPSTPPAPRAAAPAPPRPPPAPRAPTPPAFRKAPPVPPKAPPPPPSRTRPTASNPDIATDPFGLPPPRGTLPSVTTSAPTIEALTAVVEDAGAREAPPPPTIQPDVPSEALTPNVPLAEPDEVTPVILNVAALVGEDPAPFSPKATPFELLPSNVDASEGDGREEERDAPEEQRDAPEEAVVAPSTADDGASAEPISPAPSEEELAIPEGLAKAFAAIPLTSAQKKTLADLAVLETLASEEDVSVSCLALVVEGRASAQATVADVTAVSLKAGDFLYARSSIAEALSLRLVAEADGTVIANFDHNAEAVLAETPDLVERLKHSSNRAQAIAGASMGPVGDRLDDALRLQALEKLEVRVLAPNETIAPAGQPVPGMVIVGVGAIELEGNNGGGGERLGPGDFLFATEVLGGGPAPTTARAGAKGAIVLFGGRAVAHELLLTCPPLLEVFAGM